MSIENKDTDCICSLIKDKSPKHERKIAMSWLKYWLNFNSMIGKNGAVIWDIDETLVDNDELPYKEVQETWDTCIKKGYTCVVLTARPDFPANRTHTKKVLQRHGFYPYEALYMMPEDLHPTEKNVSRYKYAARDDVSKRHKIIGNIGNRCTDLWRFPQKHEVLRNISDSESAIIFPNNSHSEVSIKLPTLE